MRTAVLVALLAASLCAFAVSASTRTATIAKPTTVTTTVPPALQLTSTLTVAVPATVSRTSLMTPAVTGSASVASRNGGTRTVTQLREATVSSTMQPAAPPSATHSRMTTVTASLLLASSMSLTAPPHKPATPAPARQSITKSRQTTRSISQLGFLTTTWTARRTSTISRPLSGTVSAALQSTATVSLHKPPTFAPSAAPTIAPPTRPPRTTTATRVRLVTSTVTLPLAASRSVSAEPPSATPAPSAPPSAAPSAAPSTAQPTTAAPAPKVSKSRSRVSTFTVTVPISRTVSSSRKHPVAPVTPQPQPSRTRVAALTQTRTLQVTLSVTTTRRAATAAPSDAPPTQQPATPRPVRLSTQSSTRTRLVTVTYSLAQTATVSTTVPLQSPTPQPGTVQPPPAPKLSVTRTLPRHASGAPTPRPSMLTRTGSRATTLTMTTLASGTVSRTLPLVTSPAPSHAPTMQPSTAAPQPTLPPANAVRIALATASTFANLCYNLRETFCGISRCAGNADDMDIYITDPAINQGATLLTDFVVSLNTTSLFFEIVGMPPALQQQLHIVSLVALVQPPPLPDRAPNQLVVNVRSPSGGNAQLAYLPFFAVRDSMIRNVLVSCNASDVVLVNASSVWNINGTQQFETQFVIAFSSYEMQIEIAGVQWPSFNGNPTFWDTNIVSASFPSWMPLPDSSVAASAGNRVKFEFHSAALREYVSFGRFIESLIAFNGLDSFDGRATLVGSDAVALANGTVVQSFVVSFPTQREQETVLSRASQRSLNFGGSIDLVSAAPAPSPSPLTPQPASSPTAGNKDNKMLTFAVIGGFAGGLLLAVVAFMVFKTFRRTRKFERRPTRDMRFDDDDQGLTMVASV